VLSTLVTDIEKSLESAVLGTAAATPSSIEARFLRVVRTLTEAMLEDLEGAIYIWMIDLALKDGDFP
jgi:hypothetical protein